MNNQLQDPTADETEREREKSEQYKMLLMNLLEEFRETPNFVYHNKPIPRITNIGADWKPILEFPTYCLYGPISLSDPKLGWSSLVPADVPVVMAHNHSSETTEPPPSNTPQKRPADVDTLPEIPAKKIIPAVIDNASADLTDPSLVSENNASATNVENVMNVTPNPEKKTIEPTLEDLHVVVHRDSSDQKLYDENYGKPNRECLQYFFQGKKCCHVPGADGKEQDSDSIANTLLVKKYCSNFRKPARAKVEGPDKFSYTFQEFIIVRPEAMVEIGRSLLLEGSPGLETTKFVIEVNNIGLNRLKILFDKDPIHLKTLELINPDEDHLVQLDWADELTHWNALKHLILRHCLPPKRLQCLKQFDTIWIILEKVTADFMVEMREACLTNGDKNQVVYVAGRLEDFEALRSKFQLSGHRGITCYNDDVRCWYFKKLTHFDDIMEIAFWRHTFRIRWVEKVERFVRPFTRSETGAYSMFTFPKR